MSTEFFFFLSGLLSGLFTNKRTFGEWNLPWTLCVTNINESSISTGNFP